jgi:hypothetical protein
MEQPLTRRQCLREPSPEIADAARLLDEAVTAHLIGRRDVTAGLIRLANMPVLRDYTESLWGAKSPYVQYRAVPDAPPGLAKDQRVKVRMPSAAEKAALYSRDGYHCRFCGIPVIRGEVRKRIRSAYPMLCAGGQLMWSSTLPFS